ncbi:hypothetical protein GGR71_002891 [Xanthomonas sp. F1]
MGSLFVVIDHPPVGGFANVVETGEQVPVEHFLAEGTIEALDEGVLVRLSRLDVLQCDAIGLEPAGERLAQKFGPLSERTTCGRPWSRLICSNTRTRCCELIEVSTSMCSTSRLKSSTTLKVRNLRPQVSASL